MIHENTFESILRLHNTEISRLLAFLECNEIALKDVVSQTKHPVAKQELENVVTESVQLRLKIIGQLKK